ncbi:MAG: class I SAM-dependent RNA methyltransferase [Anaerolineales bacterium]|nr:class I SAM-dependent RNA methyltransferase [Anaerolineales bacterium]
MDQPLSRLEAFAACAPGLERCLEQEMRALGLAEIQRVPGGVEFTGEPPDLYRANLHLRTASRVLVRLGRFHAEEFWELQKRAAKLAWERFIAPGQAVAIRATCHQSRLYHSDAVAERVALAIGERLGQAPPQQPPPDDETAPAAQLIIVRLEDDECYVSVDSSGELLHRRGYRLATAKAPLRETLAAGMLIASGWAGALQPAAEVPGESNNPLAVPLLDPFCGSGTILTEAALLALNIPPGRGRRFAFMQWPGYQAGAWDALLRAANAVLPKAPLVIMASDRDEGAVEAARSNARRAGVIEHITFQCRAFSDIEPPDTPGWVITNPPYGLRIAPRAEARGRSWEDSRRPSPVRGLYSALGDVLRERCPGWQVALLSPDEQLIRATGLSFDPNRSLTTINGGLRVTLWLGRVPDQARTPPPPRFKRR